MSVTLRVDPDKLRAKAEDISTHMQQVEKSISAISAVVNASGSYWGGEAYSKYRNEYAEVKEEVLSVCEKVKKRPIHLMTMAGVYQKTQQQNIALAQTLPQNPI